MAGHWWATCVLWTASWIAVGGAPCLAQPTAEPPASARTQAATDNPAQPPQAAVPGNVQPPGDPVSFARDVQPILTAHCLKCHGEEKRSGGLRLDTYAEAAMGGDSGRPVVGGSLESNELYARISSQVAAYRMPKNSEPLSAHEIDVLRRWIEQGSPWPVPPAQPTSWVDLPSVTWLAQLGDRYRAEYEYVYPWAVAYIVLMIGLLLVFRVRAARSRDRRWASGPVGAWIANVPNSRLLLLLVLGGCAVVFVAARGRILNLQSQLDKATANQLKQNNPWKNTAYGYPPRPVRTPGPKHVSATYYRGNCERNEQLFNRGNYLTCTFHVSLCDGERRPVHVGDPIPEGGLFVRCEIERAPGTTELLYSPEGMGSAFFLKEFLAKKVDRDGRQPVKLETLEDKQRWVAYVPIEPNPVNPDAWNGTIYLYTGRVTEQFIDGSLHYGIEYHLVAKDGKLAPESDLWMDSFGNPAFEPPSSVQKLPYDQWFGERALPVIEGENTNDPKLLGVDEHVRKGFIKPPDNLPADNVPPSDQPAASGSEPPADKPVPSEDDSPDARQSPDS